MATKYKAVSNPQLGISATLAPTSEVGPGAIPGIDFTVAKYVGQQCIVNDADVYQCVSKNPTTWVKLNGPA